MVREEYETRPILKQPPVAGRGLAFVMGHRLRQHGWILMMASRTIFVWQLKGSAVSSAKHLNKAVDDSVVAYSYWLR